MRHKDPSLRQATELTCRCCGQTMPIGRFELLRTGTHRRVCRQCKYLMYDRPRFEAARLRQLDGPTGT